MSTPGPTKNKPPAALVNAIVEQEAKNFGVPTLEVLSGSHKPIARAARTAAIERIMRATNCSHGGLEKVWGASLRKLHKRFRQPSPAFDMHAFRLGWAHGPERVAAILAGNDAATNRDVAKWRKLGGRA